MQNGYKLCVKIWDWVMSVGFNPWLQLAIQVQVHLESDEESVEDGEMTDDESTVILQSDTTSSLPGPPPDPSRIPVVRRVIGDMDLDAEMEKLGIEHLVLQPPKNCQI